MEDTLYKKIKSKKAFELYDVFLYLVVVVFIFSLFLGVFLKKDERLDGFKIEVNNQVVFKCDFDKNSYEISEGYENHVIIEHNSVTVYFNDQKTDFNIIVYNPTEKTVIVQESTCSSTKDCTKSPALKSGDGVIICSPHKLKVLPLSLEISDTPVTGA